MRIFVGGFAAESNTFSPILADIDDFRAHLYASPVLRHALRREPIEKLRRRARIAASRVLVADIGGEEFEDAIGSTGAGCGNKRGRM